MPWSGFDNRKDSLSSCKWIYRTTTSHQPTSINFCTVRLETQNLHNQHQSFLANLPKCLSLQLNRPTPKRTSHRRPLNTNAVRSCPLRHRPPTLHPTPDNNVPTNHLNATPHRHHSLLSTVHKYPHPDAQPSYPICTSPTTINYPSPYPSNRRNSRGH